MIIVEGPDNSGKSTLVDSLVRDFFLRKPKNIKKGPPLDAYDLYDRCYNIVSQRIECVSGRYIVDRLSLIGESIYGPIIRGKDLWVDLPEKKIELMTAINTLNPFYIYCRPSTPTLMDLSTHEEKDYDTVEHLNKIRDNQRLIIKGYDNYFSFRDPYRLFIYNYEDKLQYHQLKSRIKEYLKIW